jgi:two-component system chemotaxis sensor kinase CheA
MRFRAEAKAAERDSRALSGMVNNLLDDMKKVLMFPFASLLEILPKIVRDLSRDKGKQIELLIEGGELEIDRRILEEMKDPLIHLVRNCIDHGIEPPAERKAKGKPARGTIRITVSPRDDKVELIIADDGGGIPLAAVRSALHKSGTSSGERLGELGDQELVPYIFQSGISTSAIITEISGRGLGLSIVREKVEKLGGTVSVKTSPGSGTTFHIVLPLTVATFRGLLVRVGGEALFVLPTMYIERVVRLQREAIGTVENRETISLEGSPVSLAHLAEVLELPPAQTAPAPSDLLSMVVLAASGTHIAFLVDEVVGEQEVLLKGFGRQLSRVRNVAGATVLGNGRVAPILNVADLLKSAAKRSTFATGHDLRAESREGTAQRRTVMVVEDSITTRTLLQNILETAGFGVVTAVDGVDALTKLKGGSFDIVVSDVDMPRMNGFELTSRIRGDKNMEELPVVLVTALATREDQERGIDAGADAYIVKSSFDQSNLLEVIEQLV